MFQKSVLKKKSNSRETCIRLLVVSIACDRDLANWIKNHRILQKLGA